MDEGPGQARSWEVGTEGRRGLPWGTESPKGTGCDAAQSQREGSAGDGGEAGAGHWAKESECAAGVIKPLSSGFPPGSRQHRPSPVGEAERMGAQNEGSPDTGEGLADCRERPGVKVYILNGDISSFRPPTQSQKVSITSFVIQDRG